MTLQLKSVTAEDWLKAKENPSTPGDELCLYLLGPLYYRHSIVINKYNVWCTVDTGIHTNVRQLFEWSCVKLVYLGNRTFGVLKSKPTQQPPLLVQPSSSVLGNRLPYCQHQHQAQPINLTTYTNVPETTGGFTRRTREMPTVMSTRGRGRGRGNIIPSSWHQGIPLMKRGTHGSTTLTRPHLTYLSHGISGTTSSYSNLMPSNSPARPINMVAALPGYNFGSTMWTTRNWETIPQGKQNTKNTVSRTTAQNMSPEVAALLKTMNREPQEGNRLQSTSPPLIVLDADPPPLSETIKTKTVLTEKTPVRNLS